MIRTKSKYADINKMVWAAALAIDAHERGQDDRAQVALDAIGAVWDSADSSCIGRTLAWQASLPDMGRAIRMLGGSVHVWVFGSEEQA